MCIVIPKKIEDSEILAHFIYNSHFKKKILSEDKLEVKNIFLPNKGGVSLQRTFYCNESESKQRASSIFEDRMFCGFFLLIKDDFEKVKAIYKKDRKEFEAEIKSTPLDINNEYLPSNTKVFTDTPGNPSHADIEYINPAIINDESPNTAIRSFSRKLAKVCKLIFDNTPDDKKSFGGKFTDIHIK